MDKIAIGELQRHDAAQNTLAQVVPLYQKLKLLEDTWIEKMQNAMIEHNDLRQIEAQNAENTANIQSEDELSNLNTNTNNRIICYTCGEAGHTSTNCPRKVRPKSPLRGPQNRNPRADKEDFKTTSFAGIVCYSCKEPGHLTTQCPNRQKGNYQVKQDNNN